MLYDTTTRESAIILSIASTTNLILTDLFLSLKCSSGRKIRINFYKEKQRLQLPAANNEQNYVRSALFVCTQLATRYLLYFVRAISPLYIIDIVANMHAQ